MENTLYYGDNLDILKRYIPDESIDLVYLDPPFKSNQNYNVLFKEQDGTRAASQIRAFEDTWSWDQEDEAVYADIVTKGGKASDCLQAFRTFLGPCDMLAYLVMMAPRLVELRRVLKPTGSIYLHCDPTASHYLKMLMDSIFNPGNYRNEITWLRSKNPKGSQYEAKRFSPDTDILLFYATSEKAKLLYGNIKTLLSEDDIKSKYDRKDEIGPFTDGPILRSPSMGDRPNLVYEYNGYIPGPFGWRVTREKLIEIDKKGNLGWSSSGKPYRKLRPEDDTGGPIGSCWTDIPPVNPQAAERLGYPTQKPEALLERIIRASSNEGDLVLDPFCGCGTTIAAAQKLGRRWAGIDITHLAITLMKTRLNDAFGDQVKYQVIGEPVSVPDAAALAESDPYQFQWWALGLVGARPVEEKKGADKGIDGKIIFQGDSPGKFETVILSVKAGHLMANHVRDLRGVVEREKAAIGVLISMEDPTKPMETEAVTAGFFESKTWGRKYPKVQLLTVADLLAGKKVEMPPIKQVGATFKKAERVKAKEGEQLKIKDGE